MATLPKNVRKVLTHVSNENELKSVLSGVKEEVEFDITENTIDDIKKLTSLSQSGTVRFADGSSAKVSPSSCNCVAPDTWKPEHKQPDKVRKEARLVCERIC